MTQSTGKNRTLTKITPELALELLEVVDTGRLKGIRDQALLLVIAMGIPLSTVCGLRVVDVLVRNWPEVVDNALRYWLATRPVISSYVFTTFADRGTLTAKPMTTASIRKIVHSYIGEW